MKRAKIIGIRIECPRQLPTRNIPREDYAIGPTSGPRRYYVVNCDCGDIHRIPMKHTKNPDRFRPKNGKVRGSKSKGRK